MKPRVIIFGTSTFGIPSFTSVMKDDRWEVVAVVTQPAKPVGRHQEITSTPVAQWAEKNGLTILTPKTLKTPEVQTEIAELKPDLFLVASYGLILPQGALDIPSLGSLNIHASILPKYRGASPISAAIVNGDGETGVTFMVMDAGCDTGAMLSVVTCPITATDTRQTLETKLSDLAATSITDVLDGWTTKKIVPQVQPADDVSLAPKIQREDGRAIWNDAEKLSRQLRAYQPWPGLWTIWNNAELKIIEAVAEVQSVHEPAGTIVLHDDGWAVACTNGYLIPQTVQFSGKKPQPAKNIPGSYPNFIGSTLN